MQDQWETKRILITVKTYPTPAWKGGEVVCMAGITSDGQWIRLFPIPFRTLADPLQFAKYQWIEARVKKATNDPRPESYHVDVDSIQVKEKIDTDKHGWANRWSVVSPLASVSMCQLRAERDENHFPTLGIFRPARIERLRIEPTDSDWSREELERLARLSFLDNANIPPLEKIPFSFYYDFTCADVTCRGHKMSCTDWEMSQSYRIWKRKYGTAWLEKFLNRYEYEMQEKNDTHFYVGTLHGHPNNWIVIGLWYPRKRTI